MKIDKSAIDKVLKMDDDQLWRVIQYVGKKSGQPDIQSMKRPDDMSKIRTTLSMLSDDDIQKAIDIMKKRKNNE